MSNLKFEDLESDLKDIEKNLKGNNPSYFLIRASVILSNHKILSAINLQCKLLTYCMSMYIDRLLSATDG